MKTQTDRFCEIIFKNVNMVQLKRRVAFKSYMKQEWNIKGVKLFGSKMNNELSLKSNNMRDRMNVQKVNKNLYIENQYCGNVWVIHLLILTRVNGKNINMVNTASSQLKKFFYKPTG